MSGQKKYNIGVIGAGWIAAGNPENLEKVRSSYNIPKKTHDYRDILMDPAVDLVLIATSPDMHKEMFVETLQAGKVRETRYKSECPKEEDGFYQSRHLINVLDGVDQPAISLETAKKQMVIIFQCCQAAD